MSNKAVAKVKRSTAKLAKTYSQLAQVEMPRFKSLLLSMEAEGWVWWAKRHEAVEVLGEAPRRGTAPCINGVWRQRGTRLAAEAFRAAGCQKLVLSPLSNKPPRKRIPYTCSEQLRLVNSVGIKEQRSQLDKSSGV